MKGSLIAPTRSRQIDRICDTSRFAAAQKVDLAGGRCERAQRVVKEAG